MAPCKKGQRMRGPEAEFMNVQFRWVSIFLESSQTWDFPLHSVCITNQFQARSHLFFLQHFLYCRRHSSFQWNYCSLLQWSTLNNMFLNVLLQTFVMNVQYVVMTIHLKSERIPDNFARVATTTSTLCRSDLHNACSFVVLCPLWPPFRN